MLTYQTFLNQYFLFRWLLIIKGKSYGVIMRRISWMLLVLLVFVACDQQEEVDPEKMAAVAEEGRKVEVVTATAKDLEGVTACSKLIMS